MKKVKGLIHVILKKLPFDRYPQ